MSLKIAIYPFLFFASTAFASMQAFTLNCEQDSIFRDVKKGKDIAMHMEHHSAGVTWRFRNRQFTLSNYFLDNERRFSQPVLDQSKMNEQVVSPAITSGESQAASYAVNGAGRVIVSSSKSKTVLEKIADGTVKVWSESEGGERTPIAIQAILPGSRPDLEMYQIDLILDGKIIDGIQALGAVRKCSEVKLPSDVFEKTPSKLFEGLITKFASEIEKLEALEAAHAPDAEIDAQLAKTEKIWDGLISKRDLERLKLPSDRRRQNENRYHSGTVSDGTRRRIDCLMVGAIGNATNVPGLGEMLTKSCN